MILTDLIPVDLSAKIESWLSELSPGHSAFQLEHFVIGQFLTPDRKYRQCLLELSARYNSLKLLEFDCKDLFLKIEWYESRFPSADSLRCRRYQNKIARAKYQIEQIIKRAEGIVREINCLVDIGEKEKARREYASFEESEQKYWETKRKEDAKLPLGSLPA